MKRISDTKMFEALSSAQKLYAEYQELAELCATNDQVELMDNYVRDMKHPLSLVIHEEPNASLERSAC